MLHKGLRHILKGCLQPKWMAGMGLLIKLLSPIKSGPSKSLKFLISWILYMVVLIFP